MTADRGHPPPTLIPAPIPAPTPIPLDAPAPRKIFQIIAGRFFDSHTRELLTNQVITVDGDAGVVLDVSAQSDARAPEDIIASLTCATAESLRGTLDVRVLDQSHLTVLPGLVDAHVHMFLHPYSEVSWSDQLTKESLAERTIRATVHARKTLLAGFTTVRDLGTEGAFEADLALRKCLSGPDPIIPGPRYYCATRAIISTGAYGPRSSLYPHETGVDGVIGAQPVDGVDECVKEVRRQIGAGADWIKIYADYRTRSALHPLSTTLSLQSLPTFTTPELTAMIETAHAQGVKVSAHAQRSDVVSLLIDLGVDTIEHAPSLFDKSVRDRTLIRKFARNKEWVTWVPTLSVFYTSYLNAGKPQKGYAKQIWDAAQVTFQEVLKSEMDNIACGGDTGPFAHGENALELVLMRKLGAPWERILGWATYGGWICVRGREWEGPDGDKKVKDCEGLGYMTPGGLGEPPGLDRDVPFGAIRVGWAADIIAVEGKIDGTIDEFEKSLTKGVRLVMKGGKIHKLDGVTVE